MKKLLLLSILLTAFNGQAQFWTEKATGFTPISRGVTNISIVDANTVWVAATDGSAAQAQNVREVSRSYDGGNTWTSFTANMGLGVTTLGIGSITAVSNDVAWISAFGTGASAGGVWKTTNGSAASPTWVKQTTAAYTAASFPNFVYFFDANNGVTMGDPLDGYFEIYTSSNGGTNWARISSSNIPLPLSGEYGYSAHYDVAGGSIWFGTNRGRIYKSTNMGASWTVSQSPIADFGSATISGNYSFSDANKGLLVSSSGSLYNSTDGGVTWTMMTPSGTFGNNDIGYVPGTMKVVTTAVDGSFYSLDDGMTWMEAEANTQFTKVEFLDSTTGFAGGFTTSPTAGGIYKYTGTQLPVAQFDQQTMSVYPNPSKGLIQVSGIRVNNIAVNDILGKQVFAANYGALENVNLDLTSLNRGMYLMTVTNDGGLTKTVKIILE